MRRTLQRRAIPAGYKEKASALVRFDYAGRYFLLSHLKRFGRRVCKILLGPIMWSCYVLIMRSPAIGICKKRLRSNGTRDIILPSAAGECQPLSLFGAPGISPSGLLRCGTTPRPLYSLIYILHTCAKEHLLIPNSPRLPW